MTAPSGAGDAACVAQGGPLARTLALSAAVAVSCASCAFGCTAASPPAAPSCAVDEPLAADGSCIAPGVPPSLCGDGFTSDGAGGCAPVLLAEPCAAGTMAVPGEGACHAVGAVEPPTCPRGALASVGESACHEVAPCGAAPWGTIPVDATTVYVDAAYGATDGDGSAAKPFRTIAEGLARAPSGGILAIAAGRYVESVALQAKPVKLWGRCPSMVSVEASGAAPALVVRGAASAGAEAHQLAFSGPGRGVAVSQTSGVVLDRVWIHDTGSEGLTTGGEVLLRASLVERTVGAGVHVSGSAVTIDESVLRDVQPDAADDYGHGALVDQAGSLVVTASVIERDVDALVSAEASDVLVDGSVLRDGLAHADGRLGDGISAVSLGGRASHVTLRGSTLARTRHAGIFAIASEVAVEGSFVHSTRGTADQQTYGAGLFVVDDPIAGTPSLAKVKGSLVSDNHYAGIACVGSVLDVEGSVVRDDLAQEIDGSYGVGIYAQQDDGVSPPARPDVTVRGSLLERNQVAELVLLAGDGVVEASVLRDTLAEQQGGLGEGILVGAQGAPSTLAVRACVLSGNRAAAIDAYAATLEVTATVVRATLPRASDRLYGYGIYAQASQLTLGASLLDANHAAGVFLDGGSATLESTAIRGTLGSDVDGTFGDGLAATGGATATIRRSRVERNARAGISAFSSTVTLDGDGLACNAFALDGEAIGGAPYAFEVASPCSCACGSEAAPCQVLSSMLTPPTPLPPRTH